VPEQKSTFCQSRAKSPAVWEFFVESFGKSWPEGQALFGRVVVFPDAALEGDSIEATDQMVLDQSDLVGEGGLFAAIIGLLAEAENQFRVGRQKKEVKRQQYEAEQVLKAGGVPAEVVELPLEGIRLPDPLTDEQVLRVAKALRPDLLLVPNLSATEVERELIRLSVGQLRALDRVQGATACGCLAARARGILCWRSRWPDASCGSVSGPRSA
jgi:hypothetical protein